MTATAQNIKRMVKLLSRREPKKGEEVIGQPLPARCLIFLFLLVRAFSEKRIVHGVAWHETWANGQFFNRLLKG